MMQVGPKKIETEKERKGRREFQGKQKILKPLQEWGGVLLFFNTPYFLETHIEMMRMKCVWNVLQNYLEYAGRKVDGSIDETRLATN